MKKLLLIFLALAISFSAISQTDHKKGAKSDVLNESTTDAGVTIDGVEIKDGGVTYVDDSLVTHRVDINTTRADIEDTLSYGSFIKTQWTWAFPDSSLFVVVDSSYGFHYWEGPDTLYVTAIRALAPILGANVEYAIYHAEDITTAVDSLWDGPTWPQVYGSNSFNTGETHTPVRNSIPPDHWVWIKWKLVTNMPTRGISFSVIGYEY